MVRPAPFARILPLGLCALCLGCLGRAPMRGQEVTGLDRKLSTFAFIEEGDLISLIVDVRATRYREDEAFVPIEVAVANRSLRNVTITRESFLLVDEQGNRYGMASPRDLLEQYEFLDMDRNLAELEGIVFSRFATFHRYESNFSPTRLPTRPGADTSVVRDRVVLPRFGFFIDFLYFPRPVTGVVNRHFELHLVARELPHPIFVKFIVL